MINKAALLLFRESSRGHELLFLKPYGKDFYVFPGGKQEPSETIDQALIRELKEELDAEVAEFKPLRTVVGATPDGRDITMHLYMGTLANKPTANAEIQELHWMIRSDIAKTKSMITPITSEKVLPLLSELNIW